MSFGLSPGDIYTLLTLTQNAYNGWRSAGQRFEDISNTLRSFKILLKHVYRRFDELVAVKGLQARRSELEEILQGCKSAVTELDQLIGRYKKMGHWDRLKLGLKDISSPKERLVRHMGLLTPFVFMTEMESIGKDFSALPDMVDRIPSLIQSAVAVAFGTMIDSRSSDIRSTRSSVLTTYGADDDKKAYKELRKNMRLLGIKDSDIRNHQKALTGLMKAVLISDNVQNATSDEVEELEEKSSSLDRPSQATPSLNQVAQSPSSAECLKFDGKKDTPSSSDSKYQLLSNARQAWCEACEESNTDDQGVHKGLVDGPLLEYIGNDAVLRQQQLNLAKYRSREVSVAQGLNYSRQTHQDTTRTRDCMNAKSSRPKQVCQLDEKRPEMRATIVGEYHGKCATEPECDISTSQYKPCAAQRPGTYIPLAEQQHSPPTPYASLSLDSVDKASSESRSGKSCSTQNCDHQILSSDMSPEISPVAEGLEDSDFCSDYETDPESKVEITAEHVVEVKHGNKRAMASALEAEPQNSPDQTSSFDQSSQNLFESEVQSVEAMASPIAVHSGASTPGYVTCDDEQSDTSGESALESPLRCPTQSNQDTVQATDELRTKLLHPNLHDRAHGGRLDSELAQALAAVHYFNSTPLMWQGSVKADDVSEESDTMMNSTEGSETSSNVHTSSRGDESSTAPNYEARLIEYKPLDANEEHRLTVQILSADSSIAELDGVEQQSMLDSNAAIPSLRCYIANIQHNDCNASIPQHGFPSASNFAYSSAGIYVESLRKRCNCMVFEWTQAMESADGRLLDELRSMVNKGQTKAKAPRSTSAPEDDGTPKPGNEVQSSRQASEGTDQTLLDLETRPKSQIRIKRPARSESPAWSTMGACGDDSYVVKHMSNVNHEDKKLSRRPQTPPTNAYPELDNEIQPPFRFAALPISEEDTAFRSFEGRANPNSTEYEHLGIPLSHYQHPYHVAYPPADGTFNLTPYSRPREYHHGHSQNPFTELQVPTYLPLATPILTSNTYYNPVLGQHNITSTAGFDLPSSTTQHTRFGELMTPSYRIAPHQSPSQYTWSALRPDDSYLPNTTPASPSHSNDKAREVTSQIPSDTILKDRATESSQPDTGGRAPVIQQKLEISLEDIFAGATQTLKVQYGACGEQEGLQAIRSLIVSVPISRGEKAGTRIVYPRLLTGASQDPVDLHFVIEEKSHPSFERDGDDLEYIVEFTSSEAKHGWSRQVPTIEGGAVTVSDCGSEESTWQFPGLGMICSNDTAARGNLVVRSRLAE